MYLGDLGGIIPFSKWLLILVIVSPVYGSGCVVPLPNGRSDGL